MALEKAEVTATHHTVSGLAAAEAVMTRQQKEAGTALIDIGAGTTNLIVFEDGEVQHIAVIPIGGQHITNDLAIGLKTDIDVAEHVKLEHADLRNEPKKMNAMIKVGNKAYNFRFEDISMVIEARVEELLEYVEKELHKIKRNRKLPGGIIITGGTAKIKGIEEFAREKMQLPARIGKLHNIGGLVDTVEDTRFNTVVGLMILDMLLLPTLAPPMNKSTESAKALLNSIFKKKKR
jgi:cell division protein FtsA